VILRAAALWVSLAGAALAQTGGEGILVQPLDDPEGGMFGVSPERPDPFVGQNIEREERVEAALGVGAVLRALDKVSGATADIELAAGASARFERLTILLVECRYPADNPEGDAFAQLVITYDGQVDPAFAGWMVASSPALSAMDHRRYDVWVLRCKITPPRGNSDG
jgi:hypothetical protein